MAVYYTIHKYVGVFIHYIYTIKGILYIYIILYV